MKCNPSPSRKTSGRIWFKSKVSGVWSCVVCDWNHPSLIINNVFQCDIHDEPSTLPVPDISSPWENKHCKPKFSTFMISLAIPITWCHALRTNWISIFGNTENTSHTDLLVERRGRPKSNSNILPLLLTERIATLENTPLLNGYKGPMLQKSWKKNYLPACAFIFMTVADHSLLLLPTTYPSACQFPDLILCRFSKSPLSQLTEMTWYHRPLCQTPKSSVMKWAEPLCLYKCIVNFIV